MAMAPERTGIGISRYFTSEGTHPYDAVTWERRDARITNYKDRASCILFGDGAGAVLLRRDNDVKRGLIYNTLHADGTGGDVMKCTPGSRFPVCESMIALGLLVVPDE